MQKLYDILKFKGDMGIDKCQLLGRPQGLALCRFIPMKTRTNRGGV